MRSLRCFVLLASMCAWGQSGVVSSKHNLSVSGPGPIRARSETQVCIFCHVGHGGLEGGSNRPERPADFRPYASTTIIAAIPGSPTGASRLCLSCHDGTIALGETVASGTIRMNEYAPGGRLSPDARANIGTDLRRTHPVSFKPVLGPELRRPSPEDKVRLDRAGELQCTACHDPHREDGDPVQRKFLVKPNRHSQLCASCHALAYWDSNPSSHQVSLRQVPANLRESLPYQTVAENGCQSCHAQHAASERGRLLSVGPGQDDDGLCLRCHDGTGARLDVASDLARPESHGGRGRGGAHDASEGPGSARFPLPEVRSSAPRHVACVDCHNPHAAFGRAEVAPRASGALAGVWGIDLNGNRVDPVQFEYEVCFKCHGDSANQPEAQQARAFDGVRRAVPELNLRRIFGPDAPSSHPIAAPGKNPDVPSLIPPLTTASVIYCSDCHASDRGPGAGGGGPRGPHGSAFTHLLERNLSTADGTAESPAAYALCYKCHEREVLLSDRSAFRLHRKHVVDSSTPCTACHDSHGVSSLQGNPTNNAYLIDFDVSIVGPGPGGLRQYTTFGSRAGACTVTCHGAKHEETRY